MIYKHFHKAVVTIDDTYVTISKVGYESPLSFKLMNVKKCVSNDDIEGLIDALKSRFYFSTDEASEIICWVWKEVTK